MHVYAYLRVCMRARARVCVCVCVHVLSIPPVALLLSRAMLS